MGKILVFAAGLMVLPASVASAGNAPPAAPPAMVQQLMACRSITGAEQRLACYDRAAATVDQAIAKREIVVIDKQKATEAKRSLFGFSVPNFGALFGGGDDDVNQVESTVTAIGQNADGGLIVTLADGSTWSQTDSHATFPKKGQKAVIQRGTMGSYFIRLGNTPGFKAKRIG